MGMTKKKLDEYRKLKRVIPFLEAELKELWNTDKGMGNSVIMDYSDGFPRPQSVVGFDQDRYDRIKMVLNNKKKKVEEVEEWIDSIEDGQTRCVFRMFYVDGMKWERIAVKTGYSESPDYPRLHIRDAYLKKCGIL